MPTIPAPPIARIATAMILRPFAIIGESTIPIVCASPGLWPCRGGTKRDRVHYAGIAIELIRFRCDSATSWRQDLRSAAGPVPRIAGSVTTGIALRRRREDIVHMDARFDRLSKRQRESLRGVSALKGSKEIADELGIEKSTVDGYIADAVRLIGARDRRDAARQFEAYEAAQREPDKMGGDSARMAPPPPPLPVPVSSDEQSIRLRQPGGSAPDPRSPRFRLPFRQKGQVGNPLTAGERLIWIQVIAVGLAVGFGMLATGLQVLTGVIATVSRLVR